MYHVVAVTTRVRAVSISISISAGTVIGIAIRTAARLAARASVGILAERAAAAAAVRITRSTH